MKNAFLLLISLTLVSCKPKSNMDQTSQETAPLTFTIIDTVSASPIHQQLSGTCWAFSTTSFLESEILRTKGRYIELSAMYCVYNIYFQKAENYILRQGTARFTEGGCNYDPLVGIGKSGLMPYGIYQGDTIRDHGKLIAELSVRVKDFADPGKKLGNMWRTEIPLILDEYFGKPADRFQYEGNTYTTKEFLEYTGLKPEDYINLTSFIHVPQDQYFVLQIPANWSNMAYFNVSLDEYMENIDHALANGYSIAIDTDLIEPGVDYKWGVATIPDAIITPEKRQADFESFATTDDHNMHMIGKVKDQDGNIYYKCKNSWGKEFAMDGHFYLSEPYVRSKSIYIMLHKDGLMEATRAKCKIT